MAVGLSRVRAVLGAAIHRARSVDRLLVWVWRSCPRRAGVLIATLVASAAAQAGLMISSGVMVQALVDGRSVRDAAVPVVVFGVVSLTAAVLVWLRTVTAAQQSRAYVGQVEMTLAQLTLMPTRIDHLEDPLIRSRTESGIDTLREGVHQRVVPALTDLWGTRLAGAASAVVLVGFHWWAPVVMLAGYALLIRGYRRWLQTVFDDLAETTGQARRRAEYYRSLMGEPGAAKEVRLFGLAPWLDDRFARTWTTAMRAVWANRATATGPVVLGGIALLFALIIVVGVLGWQAVTGLVSVGAILVYVQAVAGMDALSYQGESGWHLSRGRAEISALESLSKALAGERPTADPAPAAPRPAQAAAAVSITNLTFRYPGQEEAVLRGLSLRIPAGQSVGIVGVNGAGKSTLVKLLCGLYAPTQGEVLIDGRPAASDCRHTAAIFQSFGHYQASLADNVGFGDIDQLGNQALISEVLDAAGGAELLDRVGLPTMLAAGFVGGTELSGGQWQRVALARALLAARGRAKLLILDEPTAALDIRAEIDVFARFLDLTRRMTTVLVSHRLSSVRRADRIVVLDEGRVVEDGTHDDLIAAGGRYAAMFALQRERFLTNDEPSPPPNATTTDRVGDHDA